MKRTGLNCLVLVLLASPVLAQGTASSPAPSTELGGLVDLYYDFYSTKPTGDAQYRNFDTRHNQFALSMAEVWVSKAPTADSRAGFKVRLNFGPAASNFINAYEPGGAPYQNIEEAFASYLAPAGKGLQIDFGKFVTPLGAEVIEAKDNANYSRSLLFVLAIPIYHAGVRLNYAPTDKVSVMGGVVNGWNNVVENNTGKTLMGNVTFKPTGELSFIETYMGGPEQAGNNGNWRHVSDTVVSYTASPTLTLMANYDYGHESYATTPSAHWQGIALYAKIQANKSVTFTPRYEYYDDASGWSTGVLQKLNEFTATLELKGNDNLLWRIEYRGDFSDQPVFKSDTGALKKNQQSIGFGLLYSFASKIQ
jgi:Putative beta-barrel porin-2, OmpL-like. bbp2